VPLKLVLVNPANVQYIVVLLVVTFSIIYLPECFLWAVDDAALTEYCEVLNEWCTIYACDVRFAMATVLHVGSAKG